MRSASRGRYVEEDGWAVVVDRDSEFVAQQVRIRVMQRAGHGHYFAYGLDSSGVMTQTLLEESVEIGDEPAPFKLPAQAVSLISRALLDSEPASERLTNKLEELLDREAERVDKLIEKVSTSSPLTTVINNSQRCTA